MGTITKRSGLVGLFVVLSLASCAAEAPSRASENEGNLGAAQQQQRYYEITCPFTCHDGARFDTDVWRGWTRLEAAQRAVDQEGVTCASHGGLATSGPCTIGQRDSTEYGATGPRGDRGDM